MKWRVLVARRPGELDSATLLANQYSLTTRAFWDDCLRDRGTVADMSFDTDAMLVERFCVHHRSDGSQVGIPAGQHRVSGSNLQPSAGLHEHATGRCWVAMRRHDVVATARRQSSAWYGDVLDGGRLLEIRYDDSHLTAKMTWVLPGPDGEVVLRTNGHERVAGP